MAIKVQGKVNDLVEALAYAVPWWPGTASKQQLSHKDSFVYHISGLLSWLLGAQHPSSCNMGMRHWGCNSLSRYVRPWESELLPGNLHILNWKFGHLGDSHLLFFSGISRINLGLPTLRSYNHPSTDLFQPVSRIHLNPSPMERESSHTLKSIIHLTTLLVLSRNAA